MAHTLRVHMPLGGEAILRAQQDEDEDREARLQGQPVSRHLLRSMPRSFHERIIIYILSVMLATATPLSTSENCKRNERRPQEIHCIVYVMYIYARLAYML